MYRAENISTGRVVFGVLKRERSSETWRSALYNKLWSMYSTKKSTDDISKDGAMNYVFTVADDGVSVPMFVKTKTKPKKPSKISKPSK